MKVEIDIPKGQQGILAEIINVVTNEVIYSTRAATYFTARNRIFHHWKKNKAKEDYFAMNHFYTCGDKWGVIGEKL